MANSTTSLSQTLANAGDKYAAAEKFAQMQIKSGNPEAASRGQAALAGIQRLRGGGVSSPQAMQVTSSFSPDTNGQFDPVKVMNNFVQSGPWKPGTQTLGAIKQQQDADLQNKQLAENQRQFNITSAADLSDKFGVGILPKSSGQELFNQVAGKATLGRTTADRNYDVQKGQLATDLYNAQTNRLNADTNAFSAQSDDTYKQGMLGIESAKLTSPSTINKAITYANGAIDKLKVSQPGWKLDSNGEKIMDENGKYVTGLTSVDLNPTIKSELKQNYYTALNAVLGAGGDPYATLAQTKDQLTQHYGQYQGKVIYNLLQSTLSSVGE